MLSRSTSLVLRGPKGVVGRYQALPRADGSRSATHSVVSASKLDIGSGIREASCAEHLRLLAAVTSSGRAVNAAKAEFDQAKKEKRNIAPSRAALAAARSMGRSAVAALSWHRKVHGCGGPQESSSVRDATATAGV